MTPDLHRTKEGREGIFKGLEKEVPGSGRPRGVEHKSKGGDPSMREWASCLLVVGARIALHGLVEGPREGDARREGRQSLQFLRAATLQDPQGAWADVTSGQKKPEGPVPVLEACIISWEGEGHERTHQQHPQVADGADVVVGASGL